MMKYLGQSSRLRRLLWQLSHVNHFEDDELGGIASNPVRQDLFLSKVSFLKRVVECF